MMQQAQIALAAASNNVDYLPPADREDNRELPSVRLAT